MARLNHDEFLPWLVFVLIGQDRNLCFRYKVATVQDFFTRQTMELSSLNDDDENFTFQ